MTDTLAFFPLEEKWVPQLVAIETLCFCEPWSAQSFCDELQNPNARYVLAAPTALPEQVAAYAGMWMIVDEAHVNNVATHPAFQKKGYALQVMRRLICLAKQNGAVRMTLEVRESNAPAICLYHKLGFEVAGVRKRYYGDEDALIMWKEGL